MLICPECFIDSELQAEVKNNISANGVCDGCGRNGDLADLTIFQDFFSELLSLFEPSVDGMPVYSFLEDWNLFVNETVAGRVLHEVLALSGLGYTETSLVDYKADVKEEAELWNNLKKEVRESTRFFASIGAIPDGYLQAFPLLRQGMKLYRARIVPEGRKYLTKSDMGCPPKECAKAGRANPIGIPYLYLCQDPDTTYYEVRALHLDKLAVGTFEIQRDLSIVDFNTDANLFIAYSNNIPLKNLIIKKVINDSISADMSKPLRRYDSELEYVPTQLICEFCRVVLHADGIRFNSSLQENGINYVLFDSNDAKCIKVRSHQIGTIKINCKK